MIRFLAGSVAALLVLSAGAALGETPPAGAPVSWPLSFDDEFDFLDLGHWNTTFDNGNRTHGVEAQVYVDPKYTGGTDHPLGLNPFFIKDGILTIRATQASDDLARREGHQYVSGLLTTAHHFQQLYGYFECRAKLPQGHGLWPAFWLVSSESWPPEIDIFEIIGDIPHTVYGSLHWTASGRPEDDAAGVRRDNVPLHRWKTLAPTVSDVFAAFHTYGALWTQNLVTFYFDGHPYGSIPTPQDMHKPMYIILNLAVGGGWPGWPNASTKFPADMQVEYVRVHTLPELP